MFGSCSPQRGDAVGFLRTIDDSESPPVPSTSHSLAWITAGLHPSGSSPEEHGHINKSHSALA